MEDVDAQEVVLANDLASGPMLNKYEQSLNFVLASTNH